MLSVLIVGLVLMLIHFDCSAKNKSSVVKWEGSAVAEAHYS